MVPGTGIETGTRSTTSPRSVAQGRLFGTRDFKLRCFAGVSAAGARSRNPEAQRGISKLTWCPGPESNRYVPFGTRDFKSRASASFATRACLLNINIVNNLLHEVRLRRNGVASIGGRCGGRSLAELLDCR